MKRQVVTLILSSALSSLFGTAMISAQDQQEVANIPFAYQLGNQERAAGRYVIQETSTLGLFKLQNAASGEAMFVMSTPDKRFDGGPSKLVFNSYAGQYSLTQIWMQGSSYRLTHPTPIREASNRMGLAALVSVPLTSR